MSASISRERGSSNDPSSDAERPHKKHKAASSSSSTRDPDEEQESKAPAIQDITALALNQVDQATDGAPLHSAFTFSPAKPPAAYSSSRLGPGPLGHAPPSAAASRRCAMSSLQRHVDSFAFHSRDRLENRAELPDSFTGYGTDYAMRIDTFDATGALLWLQVECLEEGVRGKINDTWWSRGCTFAHTNVDTSGRARGQERLLGNDGPRDDFGLDDELENLAEPRNRLQTSHLGLSPYAHETPSASPFYDVVLYDFDEEASHRPRGMMRTQFVCADGNDDDDPDNDTLEETGGWLLYDRHCFRPTLSAPIKPLEVGDACSQILECVSTRDMDERRGEEMNLTITIQEESPATDDQDFHWSIREFHLAPFGLSFTKVPSPPGHRFSKIAINDTTGFCWLGKLDGTVEFLDIIDWIEANFCSCPGIEDESLDHDLFCDCNVEAIKPVEMVSTLHGLGAVTNLVAVGEREVVVAFADGTVALLEASKSRTINHIRDFYDHVNEGSRVIEMAVHAPSRLLAARGIDGHVQIWHLDNSYPLNTGWHRPRAATRSFFGPIPQSLSQQGRPLACTEMQDTKSVATQLDGEDEDEDDGETWDRLATEDVDDVDFQYIEDVRLADMRVKPFCGMAWTHTSWLADRDGQWEMARDFDAAGRPKVVSAGLLPSLVCCSDRPKGTTFMYFEPARKVGIEDAEVEEGQQLAGEAAAEVAAVSYEGAEALD